MEKLLEEVRVREASLKVFHNGQWVVDCAHYSVLGIGRAPIFEEALRRAIKDFDRALRVAA